MARIMLAISSGELFLSKTISVPSGNLILAAGTPLIFSAHSGVYLARWLFRAATFSSVLALGLSVALMNLNQTNY